MKLQKLVRFLFWTVVTVGLYSILLALLSHAMDAPYA